MHDEIERRQALDDARRLVVQTLLLFQIVEQGRLPVQTLRRCCAEPVLDALGPIIPAAARGSLAAPKVTRVRVQAIGDNLVHAAAVARRPDGQPAGYVLELRRDGIGRDWQVHQLTRAQDRRVAVHEPGEPHRPPIDFARAISTVEGSYRRAAEQLRRAEDHAEQLRRDAAPGRRPGSPVKRAAINGRLDQADRDVARWNTRVQQLARELDELRDMRAVIPEPDRLERLLGPQPHDRQSRTEWRATAAAVDYYRHRWGVTATDALPEPGEHASMNQRQHHAETARIVAAYLAPSSRELRTALPPQDNRQRGRDTAEGIDLTP